MATLNLTEDENSVLYDFIETYSDGTESEYNRLLQSVKEKSKDQL